MIKIPHNRAIQLLEERLKELNRNLAIQGELHGEGIQKNKYKLKLCRLYTDNKTAKITVLFINASCL